MNAAFAALAGCSSPTAPRQFQPKAGAVSRDDPPPGAIIIGECPYGSGFLVSAG